MRGGKKIYEQKINLKDISSEQYFKFDLTIPEDEDCYSTMLLLEFEIVDVYSGSLYDDTAISEIKVYAEYASDEM